MAKQKADYGYCSKQSCFRLDAVWIACHEIPFGNAQEERNIS